jgi:hypothetical protein
VIQFTNEQGTVKQWIWQEKGFPLKIESVTSIGNVTITINNIDFSDIPDSLFELPAGVQITDMGQFTLPTGMPTNLPTNIPGMPTNVPGTN